MQKLPKIFYLSDVAETSRTPLHGKYNEGCPFWPRQEIAYKIKVSRKVGRRRKGQIESMSRGDERMVKGNPASIRSALSVYAKKAGRKYRTSNTKGGLLITRIE